MSSRTLFQQLSKTIRPRTAFTSTIPTTRFFHATTANMTVTEFKTKADFEAAIKANKTVIIDATAVWCGPCKMIGPVFEKLSEEDKFKDIFFAKFDVDNVPELTQELGVRAMPSFFYYKDGASAETLVGPNPPSLTKFVESALA